MNAAMAIVKRCGCGREYDRSWWDLLQLVGYFGPVSPDDSHVVELRNCRCESTLAIEIPRAEMKS